MATIVTRAGKGSPLTHEEVDANFTNLNDEAATKAPLASPVFTGNVGIGTSSTPTVKAEISGDTSTACNFGSTITGTTMDVTAVSSGALAVGQYVNSPTGRVRIVALGTGTGGVGTYILDTDLTGTFGINRSYVVEPTTMRLGNSATVLDRNIPFGAIEFGGAVTNIGPRGYIQVQSAINGTSQGNMLFGVGTGSATAPPRTALNLVQTNAQFPGNLSLGVSALSPRNLTTFPANLFFGGRSQTIFTSGSNLSTLFFASSYIDGGVETSNITYGQIGYTVDSSITSGQLPSNFYIQTRNASGTTAERFRITKDGNVGIGTTAPAAKLEVVGTAQVTGVFNVGGQLLSASSGTTSAPALADATGVSGISFPSGHVAFSQASTERMRIDNNGRVGIGTSSPAYILDVNGSANAGNTRLASLGVGTDASGTTGEIRATDNITAYYSDDRLKTRIGGIDDALGKVMSLSGFYYEANETAQALGYKVKQEVGVSAQEVQAVMPEVVAPAPIDEKYLTVRYERLVPLLIEAIKAQQAQIDELKSKLGV
jgi:hypothetical protein